MITEKRNLINTGILNILAMIVIYVIALFCFKGIVLRSGMLLGSVLIILIGLIPAALWLFFFYFLDRKDPEPLHMVFGAFISGVLSQIVADGFFGNILFDSQSWVSNASSFPTLHTIATQGLFPAFAIFFTIRFFFYPSKDFNERVDGLMYGAFVGIGFSFMATMSDIFAAREISLYYLVFSLLIKFGVFSSLGALIGYSFGIARFKEKQKNLHFLIGLVISCVVFTLYALLASQFKMNIATSSDIFSIGLTVVFTVVLLAIVFFLIQKTIKGQEAENLEAHKFFVDIVSVIAIVLFLAGGFTLRAIVERDAQFVSQDKKVSFTIPAAFKFVSGKDSVYTFYKAISGERDPLVVRVVLGDQVLLQGMIKTGNQAMKVGDYSVNLREYDRTVSIEDMGTKTFYGHIFEYSAEKPGQKVVISIESPLPNFTGHDDLSTTILKSLKKGA